MVLRAQLWGHSPAPLHSAEDGDAAAFRLMQAQSMRIGQRRIELSLKIAAREGAAGRP